MKKQIKELVIKQLDHLFLNLTQEETAIIEKTADEAYLKTLNCVENITAKYFDQIHLYHTGQYAMFLYHLGYVLGIDGNAGGLADRVYALNKALHGLDVFHSVKLPKVFYWEHPVGTVLGNAVYGDCLTVYQGCTVGGVHTVTGSALYPTLGSRVTLYAHASVIGNCSIGDDVVLAANAHVVNENIPSGAIVFGSSPNLVIKENKKPLTIFKME